MDGIHRPKTDPTQYFMACKIYGGHEDFSTFQHEEWSEFWAFDNFGSTGLSTMLGSLGSGG